MSTILHIIRASIFLILASFASTALSVTVGSESGGASLDGTWSHGGCGEAHDERLFDKREYQVYQGNTVEVWFYDFPSSDGSCSGVATITSETYDFMVIGEEELGNEEIGGWVDEEDDVLVDVDAPPRQDGNGLLIDYPDLLVSELAFLIPGEDSETGFYYIDDTGGDDPEKPWLLYRNAGEDDEPLPFMSIEEPLTRMDLQISPIPVPAAVWLFGTALVGFIGVSRRRKVA